VDIYTAEWPVVCYTRLEVMRRCGRKEDEREKCWESLKMFKDEAEKRKKREKATLCVCTQV